MGYTTHFDGSLNFDKPLTPLQVTYIQKFNNTRRMKRDENKALLLDDPARLALGLLIGKFGEYFVGGSGLAGQDHDFSVLDYNRPSDTQPGLWCQWTVSDDGTEFLWDGGEKFYSYIKWLEYLIENFFNPWGVKLNGKIVWQGEEIGDVGTIEVEDSKVRVREGVVLNGRKPQCEDSNVNTDVGFDQFILDMVTLVVRTWELNGGNKINKKKQESLQVILKTWFEVNRG